MLVQVGELCAARQALEGVALAPGNGTRRLPHLRTPLSGMTTEHLRPLLHERRALHLFFLVAQKLARGRPGCNR